MYLPFQPVKGSHISEWISESEVGFRFATTRQNEGKPENVSALPLAVKLPPVTGSAVVIVTGGEELFASFSHDCAKRTRGPHAMTEAIITSPHPRSMLGSIAGSLRFSVDPSRSALPQPPARTTRHSCREG